MTYNVFGGTLNLAQFSSVQYCVFSIYVTVQRIFNNFN